MTTFIYENSLTPVLKYLVRREIGLTGDRIVGSHFLKIVMARQSVFYSD